MNFGQAIEAMKAGQRVARSGWSGKGMWIALTPGSVIEKKDARAGAARLYAQNPEPLRSRICGVSCKPGEATCNGYCKPGGPLAPAMEAGSMDITIAPHIDMKAADGTLVIGWLASQTDMLAEDWQAVGGADIITGSASALESLGSSAYEAYGATTDHKNYQGLPMPTWEELPEKIRVAWRAAASRVASLCGR